jgi:hypothetical protein
MAGITTTLTGIYDQAKFDYAYYSGLIYGLDAFGWGEQYYSASSAQLPLRPRAKIYGNAYAGNISVVDGIYSIQTNVGFEINTITQTNDYLL